ncbi:MAG: AMIN domain-containing protein, partial [Acidobacteriota bacterium]
MRKQQLAMFVSLLLVLVVAAAAQTTSQLDRVNVVRDADTIRVEMNSQGTLTPKVSTLDSPARVVVDLPETIMGTRQKAISVGAQGVKGVRIGMDGQSHPTTRIVVDLEKACAYELTPGPAGKLVLSLHASADAKADVPAPVASNTASPVKAEGAPAAKASASPNEYVFVEPSYQAKSDTKPAASDDPADRAQDAAAKFSDKTTPELLPV